MNRFHFGTTLLLAASLLLPCGHAQSKPLGEAQTQRVAALLSALQQEDMAMGSVALQQGDGPPWLRAIGRARIEAGQSLSATPGTTYGVGSISKLITAVMVLQLVQEGRLSLDDKLSRWYPTLAQADSTTVAHLLAHRSGLGDIKDLPGFDSHWVFEPRGEAALVRAIAGLPVQSAPGEKARYNNSGYVLLSFIIEKAGGLPYAEALRQRITEPLQLRQTSFTTRAGEQPTDARSYHWRSEPQPAGWLLQRPTDPSVPMGAGGIRSTPADLVVFMRALFKGRLLPLAAVQQMTTDVDGFGLGIYRLPGPGGTAWGHEGVIDGFASTLAYFPDSDTALAWCGNAHQLPKNELLRVLRLAVFEPAARLPSYAPVQARVNFSVDLGPALAAAPPATVGLRGSAAPLNWRHNLALKRDPATGLWQGQVALTVRDGVALEYKYLVGDAGWERSPNRLLLLTANQQTAVVDHWGYDAERSALRQQILARDAHLFEGFNTQNVAIMGEVFSEQLEFFHDRTGKTDYAWNLRQMAQIFKTDSLRRELVPGTTEVFALGDFGALQLGSHRFCKRDGPQLNCGVYRFSNVWERTPAGWKLLRVISFDH